MIERVTKVRKLGLKAELVHTFSLDVTDEDPAREPYRFVEQIGGLYLTSLIMKELKS